MLQHILCKCVVCMKKLSTSKSAAWLLTRGTAERVCKITVSFMHFFLTPACVFLGSPGNYAHSFPMLVHSEHVRPSYPQIPGLYSTSTWLNRSPKSLEETEIALSAYSRAGIRTMLKTHPLCSVRTWREVSNLLLHFALAKDSSTSLQAFVLQHPL